ncbi:methylated-DNA--[protein]-cysteine S-methyltransferase [Enterococcus sp. UD-01]|jgi:methylated-DNA-[protein]-cysteine S-methyltransferase|uniref:methylated-DNA--[protein]-cysteine S-methyltransferase n=1 Tax=Enterococcus sp. UD-01 TaxID=3373911 RepID=UPI00383618C0
MLYHTTHTTPIGEVMLAADDQHLVGLWLAGQKYFGATLTEATQENNQLSIFSETKEWLTDYFSGQRPAIDKLSLNPSGNAFRQVVWQVLCEIPYGQVMTYKEVAQRSAERMDKSSMSAQAVGGAIGHNPISIIIPCHRVVGSNGSLTGYAGGVLKKQQLLKLEGVPMSKLNLPAKGSAL